MGLFIPGIDIVSYTVSVTLFFFLSFGNGGMNLQIRIKGS